MAKTCVAVTTEFENAPASVMIDLAKHTTVRLPARRWRWPRIAAWRRASFATAVCLWAVLCDSFSRGFGSRRKAVSFPAVLKTALGYDGKGQGAYRFARLNTFQSWNGAMCVLEEFCRWRRKSR